MYKEFSLIIQSLIFYYIKKENDDEIRSELYFFIVLYSVVIRMKTFKQEFK